MQELAKAVVAVMQAVPNVPKTGENTFHHYKYASEADLMHALQPAMAAAGLALLPISVADQTVEHGTTKAGGVQWRTQVALTYRLLHVSGEFIDLQAVGCGIDGEDKGIYKALTGALKYCLRQAFLLPTGDADA